MWGLLTFIKHFPSAKCYRHDRRWSLFLFKVLSHDWLIKTASSRVARCQLLIRLQPLPSSFQMGRRGWVTCTAWGCRKRAQMSNCVPPSLSDFFSCQLFSRKVIIWGCAVIQRTFFCGSPQDDFVKTSLERMQAEFGLGWSCTADGSHRR